MTMLVRHATADDLPRLARLARAFHRESKFADIAPLQGQTFVAAADAMIEGSANGVLLVAERGDGIVVGMAACVLFPLFFNADVICAQEVFWFVEPEHRTGVGLLLLDELEIEAAKRGATAFICGSVSGPRDAAMARLYAQRGYRPGEATYVKRLGS